jgi:hypothetical protein
VTTPVEGFRVSPAGKAPDATEYVKGGRPPETVGAVLVKATPTSPEVPVVAHVTVGSAANV